MSRYDHNHCMHVQGDCGDADTWPPLLIYATTGEDRMRLQEHFDAFLYPNRERSYPVVVVNYHRLWDAIPALTTALGLPPELARTFPARTETKRAGVTSELNATRRALRDMYAPLVGRILDLPAVLVV